MGGNLDEEPLLLCVVQNPQIFTAGTIPKPVCEQFRKLLPEAKQLKMCFIFSNVDNNGEFTPPDMMKIVREFQQFFLLDDMANVKLFGANKFSSTDLKAYKKPISLGDGYWYEARNGIEKVKMVKCEEGSL